MEIIALLAITLGFPAAGLWLVVRQIRGRPTPDETFLQHEDDWGAR